MMEQELAGEESVDSIPQPEYEAIAVTSCKSAPTFAHDAPVVASMEQVCGEETLEAHDTQEEGEEDDDDYDDGDEEECEEESEEEYSEREEAKEEEQKVESLEAAQMNIPPPTKIVAVTQKQEAQPAGSTTTKLKLVTPVAAAATQYNFVVANKSATVSQVGVAGDMQKTALTAAAGSAPVPVQILAAVNAPKMLPAKTKNNKLVMVQLVDENGKAVQPPTINTSLAAELQDQATASKLSSPVEEKGAHNAQQRSGRSSTPLSREFLALQRSVHESKILSEFVTGTAEVKARKRRKSGILGQKDGSMEYAISATSRPVERRKSITGGATHVLQSAMGGDMRSPIVQTNSTEKLRRAKLVPLKDELSGYVDESELRPTRRSRSKSVHRKSPLEATGDTLKLKRWPSDEKILKRTNMRSQNSEFVQKHMEFLNRVRDEGDASEGDDEHYMNGEDDESNLADSTLNESNTSLLGHYQQSGFRQSLTAVVKSDNMSTDSSGVGGGGGSVADLDSLEARLKAIWQPPPKRGWDSFCWKCRDCANERFRELIPCSKCVRSFHSACIKTTASTKLDNTWLCLECVTIENVLNGPKRIRRNELSLDVLSQLLSFALKRMRNVKGYSKFLYSDEELAQYSKYIVNPVTFATIQEKIEKRAFRCAEEFLNETKWILHNALILSNGISNSKEALTAKAVLKICRQETNEIDTCAECYLNANTRADWFVDVCAQPHLILWAKLKGFPYWPAKAMGPGQGSHVNVRFFGEHDRAFVPIKDCFLYSLQDPNTQTGKRSARELADCIKEVEVHIEKIKAKVGAFKYANYKTPYEPAEEMQQLEQMMPGVTEYMKRQQTIVPKPSLQYKIVKTADNHLSIIKKATATESGNDSDHSGSPGKKPKSECGESKVSTTKYEVVSKATSDDNGSSKVSAVILKRKSDGSERKKSEDSELPLPKMTKINDNETEQRTQCTNATSGKRKHCAVLDGGKEVDSERHKSKHSKHSEPRVPMLTIKTNGNKAAEAIQLKDSKENSTESEAQSMVENLVKNKQGVTIKKITKESSQKAATALEATQQKQQEPTELNKKDIAVASNSSKAAEEPKSTQKVTNILKDLVPFVEIKKEITSDDEEAANAPSNNTNVSVAATSLPPIPLPAPTAPAPSISTAANAAPEQMLLTTVKQEVMSDDEEQSSAQSKDNNASVINSTPGVVITEKATSSLMTSDTVRVVGDTTIQRIPAKNVLNAAQNVNPNISVAAAANTTPSGALTTQAQIGSGTPTSAGKRSTTRGVPYGPLPASATSTAKATAATNNTNSNANILAVQQQQQQQQQQLQQQQQQLQQLRQSQRARKSFPNRSSSDASPARGQPTSTAAPPSSSAVVASNNDIKRSLLKSSMVSIPRQAWSLMEPTLSSRAGNNAIPVPPLTAVSKHTIPITTSNEITSNNLSTSSIDVSTTPFVNCNGGNAAMLTPLTMSAPPPLAGLSQPTVSVTAASCAPSSIVGNSSAMVSVTNSTCATASMPTQDVGLLGSTSMPTVSGIASSDFVTPTLATMVTDAICRGPPKMVARPNGPLQSDGAIMFPSQAGPVCRTLVENAHKLTDFFISVMEDTMLEMSVGDESVLQAKITLLTMELERRKQSYEQELAELKRTSDLMLCEMRKSMENEKTRLANEIRKQCELERLRSIEETKKKQWCANCGREAQFYCCWNTSYCDYPCQQLHWSRHAPNCAQTRPSSNSSSSDTPTAATVSATTGGTTGAGCKQQQQQNAMTSTPPHYKTVSNSKKEKSTPKSSQSNTLNAGTITTGAALVAATTANEVLKLPSNTYVRTIPQNSSSVRSGGASAFAVPVQRFNIPLPITAPVNAPPPYTLVQRGNSWELTSAATATNNTTQSINTANIAAVAAPVGTVTPALAQHNTHQQQSRHNNANMQSQQKGSGRNRGMQSLNAMHASTLQCNVLRPAQM